MITEKKIQRINELAAKAKTEEGLTKAEIAERDNLRKEYIAAIRADVKEQLSRVKIVEDMTPEEVEKCKQENEAIKNNKN